jgi:hypothetical protein
VGIFEFGLSKNLFDKLVFEQRLAGDATEDMENAPKNFWKVYLAIPVS